MPTAQRSPRNQVPSGNFARAVPVASARAERLARAWARHPVVAFSRHRGQLAFYRQFHALLRSGVSLPVSFAELSRYAPDPGLAAALAVVARDIAEGSTLAQALQRHSGRFDDANVELIAFAEEAGKLDPVLKQLIEHLEAVHKLRWRAIFMSLWPLYLAAGFIFVGPLLAAGGHVQSAGDLGAFYVGGVLRNVLTSAALLLGVFGAPFLITAAGLDVEWDRFKRRLPIVDSALRDLYASRLMLGLGLSVGAGLEMVRALSLAVKSTSSASLQAQLPAAEAVLRGGGTLAEAITSLGLLDRASLGTLAIAERTGTLSETLERLSAELQEASLRATRVLIIVVIAVVAVVLLVSIVFGMLGTLFGPVKKLYDAAGSGNLDGL
jgi:type II secretory pathway component PulF